MLEKTLSSNQKDESIKAIASVRSTVKNLRTWFEDQGQFTLEANEFFEFMIRKLQQYYQLDKIDGLSEDVIFQIKLLTDSKYSSAEWTFKK